MDTQTKVIIISCIISAITLLISLLGVVYKLASKHTEAKNDKKISRLEREHASIISNVERQYKQELKDKDEIIDKKEQELQEWREKYFLLLSVHGTPSNNSP